MSDDQVQCSLDELLARTPADPSPARPSVFGPLPDGLVDRLNRPIAREPGLAEIRRRLGHGEAPDADDVARVLVGRLVCDRLR